MTPIFLRAFNYTSTNSASEYRIPPIYWSPKSLQSLYDLQIKSTLPVIDITKFSIESSHYCYNGVLKAILQNAQRVEKSLFAYTHTPHKALLYIWKIGTQFCNELEYLYLRCPSFVAPIWQDLDHGNKIFPCVKSFLLLEYLLAISLQSCLTHNRMWFQSTTHRFVSISTLLELQVLVATSTLFAYCFNTWPIMFYAIAFKTPTVITVWENEKLVPISMHQQ